MRMTGSGAMQTRADAKKLGGFGQMWEPGATGTVLYPIVKDETTGKFDLLVGGIWGHPADPKELGLKKIFIPSLTDMDESGEPIGTPDITYQFSRIAKLFIDGMKQKKIDGVMAKQWPNEASRKSALEAIDKEFDTQSNMKAKKPVVGKATFLITTECIYIPIENEQPQPDKARLVTQSLSDERIRKLIGLANNSKYSPDPDDTYLEVQYAFPAGDKAQSGRTDPVGQVREYRLKTTYPDQWKAIESLIPTLPDKSETIARRNFSYRKSTPKEIKNALTTYAIMNSEYLDALSNEDDIEKLVKNADVMEELSLTSSIMNPELKSKITEALEELHKVIDATATEDEPQEEPTFGDAPTIEQMLANQHRASDELLEGVDVDLN